MSDSVMPAEVSDTAKLEKQYVFLPSIWRRIDGLVIKTTEITLFFVGIMFAAMVTLEVVSRYIFNFSIFYVDGAAKLLLLWFFLLGAGLALRYGAHVGFELLLRSLPPKKRKLLLLISQAISLVFFLEMAWAGYVSLAPASRQLEPSLEVSLLWAFLAIPVGFLLLAYHMLVLMFIEVRRPIAAGGQS